MEKSITVEELDLYRDDYKECDFWNKVEKYARVAGKEVITKALQLYYAAKSKDIPAAIKAIIYGALGYFIFPLDIIPDIVPVFGFMDDLAALTTAISSAEVYITAEVEEKAKAKRGEIINRES